MEKNLREIVKEYRVVVSVVENGFNSYVEVRSIQYDHIDEANANVIGALNSICNECGIKWKITIGTPFLSKSSIDVIFSESFPEILARLSPEVKDAAVFEAGGLHAWDLPKKDGSNDIGLMLRAECFDKEKVRKFVEKLGFTVVFGQMGDEETILIEGNYNSENKREKIGTLIISLEDALKKNI
ncbi:MAG: hypothetical protein D6780_04830 [Candidatus Dadabacteria bacterium]|nr:MAG: hypothetical protein D6780_04830 [Candidatus Dadabacteria bacterium]